MPHPCSFYRTGAPILSCSAFWLFMAHSCHFLKGIALHQKEPHCSEMPGTSTRSNLTPPHTRLHAAIDRLMWGRKQAPGFQVGQLCVVIWAQSYGRGQVEARLPLHQRICLLLSPTYMLAPCPSKSLAKNLYSRVFLRGIKTIVFSCNVLIPPASS